MTDASDAAIVRQVLDGDTEAFGVLVERHQERCTRLALHITGSREDAEDAVQETFLRAYRSLASYQERDRFSAWLVRILVNQCRTTLARQRRRAVVADWDWAVAPGEVEEHPADRAALREELERALATLEPEQREAVVLKFADELTYDEIATATGASVSALKMRVQRACRRLRALLQEIHHV
jgi:RNA polymerase sigma-70 factor (ECF subfamily)